MKLNKKAMLIIGASLLIFSGCEKKQSNASSDNKDTAVKATEKADKKSSSVTEVTLKKCIEGFSEDSMVGEPVIVDFDGNGDNEMVAEFAGMEDDSYKQYFVYTNGTDTYSFGEYNGDTLYETKFYIIETDNGAHQLGFTSSWRMAALGGQMYTSGIYKFNNKEAENMLSAEFCSLDNVNKNSIEVIYYQEPIPGSTDVVNREVWTWNGNEYDKVATYLANGSYSTEDIAEEDLKNFEETETGFFKTGEIKDGYLTITASFVQWNDDYTEATFYPSATRKIKLSDDFAVYRSGGENDPEKTTIEDFNNYYTDVKNRTECRGLGISIVINDEEVIALYIES